MITTDRLTITDRLMLGAAYAASLALIIGAECWVAGRHAGPAPTPAEVDEDGPA